MTRGPRLGLPGDEPRPPSHPTRQASTRERAYPPSAANSWRRVRSASDGERARAGTRSDRCDRYRTRPRGGPLTQSELIAGMPVRHHSRIGLLAGGGTRSGAQPAPQVKPRTDMAIPPVGPGRPEGVPGLLGTPPCGGVPGVGTLRASTGPLPRPPPDPPGGGSRPGGPGGPRGCTFSRVFNNSPSRDRCWCARLTWANRRSNGFPDPPRDPPGRPPGPARAGPPGDPPGTPPGPPLGAPYDPPWTPLWGGAYARELDSPSQTPF